MLRLRQIRTEVGAAARQYRAEHGAYPETLEHLVDEGLLARDTRRTIDRLGWQYARQNAGKTYRLMI